MTAAPRPPELHVLTPGDHFSPRTGSAIPTVVDGLCGAVDPADGRPLVAVARGTYPDRYPSAVAVEYDLPGTSPVDRYLDAAAGRLGLPRPGARRALRAALTAQDAMADGVVLVHNAPQAVPLVARRHTPVLYAHNLLLRSYSRSEAGRVLDRAAAIVCVSAALAEQTADRLPAPLHSRLRVVPNGVDTDRFAPRPDPTRAERLRVLFVGRMIPDKGADVLVEAVRRLDRADITLTLVGSRNFDAGAAPRGFEQDLRQRAAALGDRVQFRSFTPRTEVATVIRSADVLVVPSRWAEPFALTVLEGMASGVPVVACAVGGIPEAMDGAGVSVPPDDPGALAEVLATLADDEGFRQRIGREGRVRALAGDWHAARHRLDRAVSPTPVG
ncbi:glycosyltransferase family 4 protein [Cellulomonas sp. NPDC089187]|uniref:glycosyltransferase family 4 protein n=1 Tax=Cellulomonas sp. NPDC089187 TaxID=3154970 RepID=UPI003419DA48